MLRNTNYKTKSNGLNTRRKNRTSKPSFYTECTTWKTQIARGLIVFGIITVFNSGAFAQCTVRDLPDSTQKMILTRFVEGEQCDSLRTVDSLHIADLEANKLDLQQDLSEAADNIQALQLEAVKRKKWPWITGAIGFVGGCYLGTRFK